MDNFEDRLNRFIQMEGITAAKLADDLGIQRGGLSHLLSGRNKPSYDFITRLLSYKSELNPEWILLGKGKPYKQLNPVQDYDTPESAEKETLALISNDSHPSDNRTNGLRSVSRITIFYSDGTFEER